MAAGRTLDKSAVNLSGQLEVNFFNVVSKYIEYVEYNKNNDRIRWTGDFEKLKNFVSDLFGNDGKWSSPGGSAKSDRLTITWYANKKSLLFQCELGDKLKDLVINLCRNKTQIHESEPNENKIVDRLLNEFCYVKTKVHQLSAVMNNLPEDMAMVTNNTKSQGFGSKSAKCNVAVQTDLYPANESTNQTRVCSPDPVNGIRSSYNGIKVQSNMYRNCRYTKESKRDNATCKLQVGFRCLFNRK
ncbi:Hypothetical predicted protein [Paramuricea clavata]|uniref:Uncharacterized protein n=1 Tax=Paramuricea clavata TaxID=317549 RepID=A0A6S7KFC3_PARCT|nr:Hypothetical predicted protein [Paramuricea clavata]